MMRDMTSSLFRIYDEYKLTCQNILSNIYSENIEYISLLVEKKGNILKNMLIQEKVCSLSKSETEKKDEIKQDILTLEKEIIAIFTKRHSKIKHALELIKNKKKLSKKFNSHAPVIGRVVDLKE